MLLIPWFLVTQTRTEEALAQARVEHDSHLVSGKNEQQQLNSKLESESMSRKGLEAEVRVMYFWLTYTHVPTHDSLRVCSKRPIVLCARSLTERGVWGQCFGLYLGALIIYFLYFRSKVSSLRSRLEKSDRELETTSINRVEAERWADRERKVKSEGKI